MIGWIQSPWNRLVILENETDHKLDAPSIKINIDRPEAEYNEMNESKDSKEEEEDDTESLKIRNGKNKKNGKKNKSDKEEMADSKTESARIRSPPKHAKISRRTKSKKSVRTKSGVTEGKVKESENEYDQNDENGDMLDYYSK